VTHVLVVGMGSIGSRHARLLDELGCTVSVVTRRPSTLPAFTSITAALQVQTPDVVIVANETSAHEGALRELVAAGFTGRVLVEKPLFDRERPLPAHHFSGAWVAYNLRFHPMIQRLRVLLGDQPIVSAQAYVGQYLPEWRPGSDYRASYSASDERGGGVLRDLSHDLDLVNWLLGDWLQVAALGGHLSPLEVDSDDVFALLLRTRRCPVAQLQMNYIDRGSRRRLLVNTADHTYEADLVRGVLSVDREEERFSVERDATYRSMHEAVLRGTDDSLCTFAEGTQTMCLIDAARQSSTTQTWINA
jgi:predicted dehydrogenase